jgi:hypothetical protein
MDHLNPGKTRKSRSVEGENRSQSVDLHSGHQSRVVGWFAGDLVTGHQGLPCGVNLRSFRQEVKYALDAVQFRLGQSRRQPEPVLTDGPGRHYPHFDQVLGDDVEAPALFIEDSNGPDRELVVGVVDLNGPKQGAGIDEHAILVPVGVNTLPAHVFIGENR